MGDFIERYSMEESSLEYVVRKSCEESVKIMDELNIAYYFYVEDGFKVIDGRVAMSIGPMEFSFNVEHVKKSLDAIPSDPDSLEIFVNGIQLEQKEKENFLKGIEEGTLIKVIEDGRV